MYVNYGDQDFFEHGILVDTEHSDIEFPILYCVPYPGEEDLYQFGDCMVDITDSWIEKQIVMDYIDMKETEFDPVQFAIGCVEYYGAANFGAQSYVYDWTRMRRTEIEEILKYRLIAYDNLKIARQKGDMYASGN